MMRMMRSAIAMLLVLAMTLSLPLQVLADTEPAAPQVVSTEMTLEQAKNNVQSYYSNDEWEKTYPQGLYALEHATYEIAEGGTDPSDPEDVYLGILVYRIGGNSNGAKVSFSLNCQLGDQEQYPDSVGTVEFLPQQTTATIKVKIKNDDARTGNQLLTLTLTEATNGVISPMNSAAIKIFDDEPFVPSALDMTVEEAVTDRSAGGVKVTLRRTGNVGEMCSVHVATADGTALAGTDYEAVAQDVVFLPGQDTVQVVVPLTAREPYEGTKSLSLELSDLRGCVAQDATAIRLDITNEQTSPSKELTDVSDAEADLKPGDGEALVGSNDSVINVNDTIDRTALLKTAIGSVNGTAVQSFVPMTLGEAAPQEGRWSATLDVPDTKFVYRWSTAGTWSAGSVFTNGNEDLLLTSQYTYDLNQFDRITVRIRNQDGMDIRGNPNTAFGYLTEGGWSDKDGKFYFIKDDLTAAEPNIDWMKDKDMYILMNRNNSNIDYVSRPTTLELSGDDGRYYGSSGILGSKQKLFIISYDDEGWDDTNFYFETTTLHRTVIPFNVFQSAQMENVVVDVNETDPNKSTVTFEQENFRWTITLGARGGVGKDHKTGEYGFYVGSLLDLTCSVLGQGGSNVPLPQYLYLVDSNGAVHNSAAADKDGKFTIPLETLLTTNTTSLVQDHYLSEDEAQVHVLDTMGKGSTINSDLARTLGFRVRYRLMQGIELDFGSIPALVTRKTYEDGTVESDAEWEARILRELGGTVTFFRNGESFQPGYTLYDQMLVYSLCEFDYLRVDPRMAGTGFRISSDLYDMDYQDIDGAVDIEYDVCAQLRENVTFRLYDPSAAYLVPGISVQSTGVSELTDGQFVPRYTATAMDRYIPFETLYSDTSAEPGVRYYTVRFTISDIYVGAMEGAVKRFRVNVGYECPKTAEEAPLLSFWFKGGAGYGEASDVEMFELNSKFKENTGVAARYLPVLELEDRTAAGYAYVLHIPTYYNYQNESDPLYEYYEQVFFGGDGIVMEMEDFDRGDQARNPVISALGLDRTQSVMTKMPDVSVTSDETEMTNHYFEEQNEFYTYNDHRVSMSGYKLGVDPGAVLTAILKGFTMIGHQFDDDEQKVLKRFTGTTPVYIQFGNEQVIVGGRLTINGYGPDKKKPEDLPDEQRPLLSDVEGVGDMTLNANGAADKSPLQKLNSTKVPSVYGSLDARFVFAYDRLNHQYDFNSFAVTGAVGLSFMVTAAIPPAPILYGSFSTKIGFTVSTGTTLVKDYIDANGKSHYKATWNGLAITPNVNFTLGIGLGVSGILSGEFGGSADLTFAAVLGKQIYKPAQYEFDLDTVLAAKDPADTGLPAYDQALLKSARMTFSDGWKTYMATQNDGTNTGEYGDKKVGTIYYHSYGKTLCRSEKKGDTITIDTAAGSVQVLGVKEKDGGKVRITVLDANGDVLKQKDVDLSASQTQLHQRIFTWEPEGFDNMKTKAVRVRVIIENISEGDGKRVTLDSIRIHNLDYKIDESSLAVLANVTLKLALYIKITVVGINISLEPGYLQINYTASDLEGSVQESATLTLGSFYYSKTYDLMSLRQDEGLPVVMASRKLQSSTADPDYFTTGEFAAQRTKTMLAGDIENTAKNQVIGHGGDVYAFYTVSGRQEDGAAAYYQLCWSKNGVAQGRVTEDVFVADFRASLDGDGALRLVMTASDSTVAAVVPGAEQGAVMKLTDGSEEQILTSKDLQKVLTRTCVKTVTFDHDTGKFRAAQVIGTTDANGLQESLPVAPDRSRGLVFYVEDTKTDDPAVYDLNWTGFNDDTASTSAVMSAVMDSMYRGRASIHYSLDGVSHEVGFEGMPESYLKPGFKVTSMDAEILDEDTLVLGYSVEVPYAQLDGRVGTLKQIHYRKGTIGTGVVTFEPTVVVASVFDHNDDPSVVFAGVTEVDPVYYDEEDGDFYEQILLRNVQFERAVVEKGQQVQPVMFYQTNKSISYVTYDALEQKEKTGKIYDGSFENYVLAVDEAGALTLVYSDNTESGSFADTLYITQFDGETGIWNKPRQLTHTDAFDPEAYAAREDTAAVVFDGYSAFVYTKDGDQKVAVSLKSSYVPFSYEYATDETTLQSQQDVDFSKEYDRIVVDEDGNVRESITVPVLDYESQNARTDLFMITFEEKVTKVEVQELELSNTRFLPGEEIRAYFTVVNTGDTAIDGMNVSLAYYHPSTGSLETVVAQKLTGSLLSGDRHAMALSYTVPETRIADGTALVVQIRDATNRRSLYQSYLHSGEKQQYHMIHDLAEFYFYDNSVEISSDGVMEYILDVGNKGMLDAAEDVEVCLDLYEYHEDLGEYHKTGTLFSVSVAADRLASGAVTRLQGKLKASGLLDKSGKLYYGLRIESGQKQYDTTNDEQSVLVAQQIPEVELGVDMIQTTLRSAGQILAGRRTIRSLKLGDEVVLDAQVVSDFLETHDIEVFEVGSNCLSMDKESEPGKVKIKVVAMPEDGAGNIKLKVRIGDTVIDKSVFLQITNTDMEDLDGRHVDADWTVTGETYSYALEHDLVTTGTDGAQIALRFRGEDLKLYGDRLTDGGDLQITVRDSQGNEVICDTVGTRADRADRGMLLYSTGDLPLDTYDVTIRAILEDGEQVALDHVTFKADVSDADITPYPVIRSTNEVLDAPLLSGRSRDARFTVIFDRDVVLAEGKTPEEMTMCFDEYEDTGDGYVATGKQVTFVAAEIVGRRVIFTTKLSSTPGAVLKYVLADGEIPEGFLVAAEDGVAVATQIPDYTGVSYVLKESGISSVAVVEDTSMPAGSVQKSVRVKFLTEPDLSRLEGTKLLYLTRDLSGQAREIPFRFCGMTEDPRVAIYRADALELEREEIQKLFAFRQGIVLNEKEYVLVTAEGDYLENDVTTVLEDTSVLDIRYEKLKAATAPWIGISGGRPTVYVSYPEAVSHEGEAFVQLRQKILKDGSEEVRTLRAELTGLLDEKTLMFQTEPVELPEGAVVSYSLISDKIGGEGTVIRVYDGIGTDPTLKEAQILTLDTDLRISESRVYLDGGMKPSGSVLKVDVTFRAELEEESLAGTTVEVVQKARSAAQETSTVLTLGFDGMRVEDGTTVVTYRCAGDVSFAKEELSKQFQVGQQVQVPAGSAITTADGRQVAITDIAQRDTLEVARAAAGQAELALVERGEGGYHVAMTLTFPEDVHAKVLQNIMATVTMGRPDTTDQLGMALERCEDGMMYFLSDLPLSLYAGVLVTFRTPEEFYDVFESVVDGAGIAVSTRIPTAELTVDNTAEGLVEAVDLRLERGRQTQLVARVRYDEVLLEKSFLRSAVPVTVQILYADGQTVSVEKELTFKALEGEDTAVYTAQLELPGDMASVTLTLGDRIDTYGGNHLFNVGQTLKLSAVLPETAPVTVEALAAQRVQILTDRIDGTVQTLADTKILVGYPEAVTVTAPEGLTLTVRVRGIEGVDTVTYQAVARRSGRVLELRPVDAPRTGYGDRVELTLSGAVLTVAEGTEVLDGDGLQVNRAVPDATRSFRVRRSAGSVWDQFRQAVTATVEVMKKIFGWFLGK